MAVVRERGPRRLVHHRLRQAMRVTLHDGDARLKRIAEQPRRAGIRLRGGRPSRDQVRQGSPSVRCLEPVLAIYVPQSPGAGIGAGLWRATARYLSGSRARIEHILRGVAMTHIPADRRYSNDHLWAEVLADGSAVRVGVTDFAQQSLGDVVDVTPPRLGETVTAGRAATSSRPRASTTWLHGSPALPEPVTTSWPTLPTWSTATPTGKAGYSRSRPTRPRWTGNWPP